MKSRVFSPNSLRAALDSDPLRKSSAEVEQLIIAGRSEQPASDLAQRVREAVTYRTILAVARPAWLSPRVVNRRVLGLASLAGSAALAASATLWWQAATHKAPFVMPEPVATAAPDGFRNAQPGNRRLASDGAPSASASAIATGGAFALADRCRQQTIAEGRQPLIDDFEDGDDEVLSVEGRSGFWRWARDTDAPGSAPALLPIPRAHPSDSSRMALHVKGGRLLDWGAIVEFNFRPGCYDASAYGGLTFQARGPGRVFVAPREIGTIPAAEGGTCTTDCYNPHVKKVELERYWKSYRIEWREFEQRGYGRPAFDPKWLHSIAFLIRPEDTPYDVWFDDVSFVSRQ